MTPNTPLDWLPLGTTFRKEVGNVLSILPGAYAQLLSGEVERCGRGVEEVGKWLGMPELDTRTTFPILKSHSKAKVFILNE